MTVYSFRIAYASEDELQTIQEQPEFDPSNLVLTTLPNGQPSFKTLYVRANTEDDAVERMNQHVSVTPYSELKDNTFI